MRQKLKQKKKLNLILILLKATGDAYWVTTQVQMIQNLILEKCFKNEWEWAMGSGSGPMEVTDLCANIAAAPAIVLNLDPTTSAPKRCVRP